MKTRMPAEIRKAEIRELALKLAFKVGPEMVTTGMIAADMGLSQPAIYKHFPSKAHILAEIARHLGERIAQNTEYAKTADDGPVARLKTLVFGHLKLLKEYPALPEFMIMRNLKDGHNNLQAEIQSAMRNFSTAVEAEVKSAVQEGLFRDSINPADATMLIFGVIQSLVLRMLVSRNPEILITDGARLLELQLAGFMAKGDDR